jgi:glycosyltransferase involved in cell wall biosynthesis
MVDRYSTVSESVKHYFSGQSGISEKKISVIYNGVTFNSHAGASAPCDPLPFSLAEDARIVLAAGRLHEQKGYRYLLQAMARVQKEIPAVKLILAGEGDDENKLKNLAKVLDLTEHIVFAGVQTDIGTILNRAECVVLSSLWEGMPNVLLESMAAGKPVVATAVGGVPEIVVDGETGILVPPRDSGALANGIISLLRDSAHAAQMGRAGKARVEKAFTIAHTIQETDKLYRELLTGKHIL